MVLALYFSPVIPKRVQIIEFSLGSGTAFNVSLPVDQPYRDGRDVIRTNEFIKVWTYGHGSEGISRPKRNPLFILKTVSSWQRWDAPKPRLRQRFTGSGRFVSLLLERLPETRWVLRI